MNEQGEFEIGDCVTLGPEHPDRSQGLIVGRKSNYFLVQWDDEPSPMECHSHYMYLQDVSYVFVLRVRTPEADEDMLNRLVHSHIEENLLQPGAVFSTLQRAISTIESTLTSELAAINEDLVADGSPTVADHAFLWLEGKGQMGDETFQTWTYESEVHDVIVTISRIPLR